MKKYVSGEMGENANVIDRFFYIISQQLKLTIKAMSLEGLPESEASELEELKSFKLELNLKHLEKLSQKLIDRKDRSAKDLEFGHLYSENIGPTFHDALTHYDKINKHVLDHHVSDQDSFEKLFYVYFSGKISHFHICAPINLTKSSLVLPRYDIVTDDFDHENIEPWKELIESVLTNHSMSDLISKLKDLTAPEKIKEFSKVSKLEDMQTRRWGLLYTITNRNDMGAIVPWENYISYQHLMLAKLQDEVIFELEG